MVKSVIPFLFKGANMTIEEALAEVDELKPNQYSDTIKVSWLSKLDQKVWAEVINRYEKETTTSTDTTNTTSTTSTDTTSTGTASTDTTSTSTTSTDTASTTTTTTTTTDDTFNGYTINDITETLLVDDAYADLYIDYCFAMIDYNNQELDRYTNSMLMFNSKYADYKNYYNRTHTIKTSYLKVW